MDKPQRYLITAALPYANGPLHVGHIAGAYLPADIYVRYLKLHKKDVAFVCGSDEHGVAITIQAKKEGISPQDIIDKYHALNGQTFKDLKIDFDIFHRTSSEIHHKTSSEFFVELHNKSVFDEKESEQYYDEDYKQFLADRYIVGTCPKCGNTHAYGDQCEKCGTSLSSSDLIDPKSALSGKTPVKRITKHWYLPLQNYEDWLRRWLVDGEGRTEPWKKNVIGQCKSWLDDGLAPRAITRDLDWGVKVPVEGGEGKVLYVWMDAPIGYISATKQWALDNNKDWKDYWCDEGTKLVHFIGKDNIVFHCIIFPVILKEMEGFILPTNVPANEFMNLEGEKMSTSRNWSLPVHEFLKQWPGKEDVLRYVLASNLPEAKDSEFTWKDFQARNNNELVAILGNFVNRVLVLTHKFFDGETPSLEKQFSESDYISAYCAQLALIKKEQYDPAMESYRFREALSSAMEIVRLGNKLLTDYEPWKLIKTEPETCASVLRVCLESFSDIIWLMSPFLPNTTSKMMEMVGLKLDDYLLPFGSRLNNTTSVGKPVHLFQRIEDEPINEAINQLKSSKVEITSPTVKIKPEITFEDFSKLDIRTAIIESATRIPKADKLMQIEVVLGHEKRTIVSGIAEHFTPEELSGKRVLVVANLAPRKMRGVTSEGMILMAEDSNGNLYFVGEGESGMSGLSVN